MYISCVYIVIFELKYLMISRSDRVHFGIVESQGGGKFICHVFAEYKVSRSYFHLHLHLVK